MYLQREGSRAGNSGADEQSNLRELRTPPPERSRHWRRCDQNVGQIAHQLSRSLTSLTGRQRARVRRRLNPLNRSREFFTEVEKQKLCRPGGGAGRSCEAPGGVAGIGVWVGSGARSNAAATPPSAPPPGSPTQEALDLYAAAVTRSCISAVSSLAFCANRSRCSPTLTLTTFSASRTTPLRKKRGTNPFPGTSMRTSCSRRASCGTGRRATSRRGRRSRRSSARKATRARRRRRAAASRASRRAGCARSAPPPPAPAARSRRPAGRATSARVRPAAVGHSCPMKGMNIASRTPQRAVATTPATTPATTQPQWAAAAGTSPQWAAAVVADDTSLGPVPPIAAAVVECVPPAQEVERPTLPSRARARAPAVVPPQHV